MAIDDTLLQSFFKKQRKAPIDALINATINSTKKNNYEKTAKVSVHKVNTRKIQNENHAYSSNDKLTKREQFVSNSLAETLAMRETSASNMLSEREQCVSKKDEFSKMKQTNASNALAEPLAGSLAMRETSVSNSLAKGDINTLVGNEKKLLLFVFQKCQLLGSLETSSITTELLIDAFKVSSEHLRNIIYRLSKKGFIAVTKTKNGRFGWRKFTLSKEIFQKISLDSVSITLSEREQSVSNTLAEPLAEPLASPSSSSGLKDLNTTTTQDNTLPPEWDEIDLTPLQKNNVMFGRGQIMSLWPFLKIHSAFDFQESIDGFAFDIEHNHVNARRGYLNLFIGTIRNGLLYVSSHYVSPERQRINEMLELSQKRKAEKENLENKAFELATESWISDLTEEEKNNILSQQSEGDSWGQCVKYLEKEHDEQVISTWIKPLHAEEEGGVWVLYAHNEFVKDEVKKTFETTIQKFLGDFILKVGNKERSGALNNPNNFSQEEISLRTYFKENLWAQKRAEFLASA